MMNTNQNFKILFVYPNIQMRTITPPGIALMAALLKEHGFQVDVFDATRYADVYTNPEQDYDSSHEKFIRTDIHKDRVAPVDEPDKRMDIHSDRVQNSNVLSFDWGEKNIVLKTSNMFDDLRHKIDSFGPDLIGFSIVENTFGLGMELLSIIPDEISVIAGGVFATYAPDKLIKQSKIDYVSRGEGEYPMLDLCIALADGKPTNNIPNIWAKDKDGKVWKNSLRPAIDINQLPVADFSIFEDEMFYTPMQGKVWRAVGFETQRGCPYTCTYCNSPSNNYTYSDENAGKFHRKKTVARLKWEMDHLVKKYKPELIYFVADTFLAMSTRELDEFSEFYQSYKIPFWMNTRAETINRRSAEHLAKMNCLRFNIGIEHGNTDFRAKVLKRRVSNKKTVESFQIAAEFSDEFTCVANSIIGLPTETPELVYDTIELNRQLPDEIVAAGAFIFAPFHGTPLRDLAIEKGYISPELICIEGSNTSGGSLMNMPQFTAKQIEGFLRTFSFYVKFPKDRWKQIDEARELTTGGDQIFEKLRQEYSENYLNPIEIQKKFEWKTQKS
jgi:anaerobic magnesium-protoporphyrin IX monomethyl ester cyclase